MPARVKDELVLKAAEALLEVAKSMTTEEGLTISCAMDIRKAKSAVMGALVVALGHPFCILPTGYTEVSNFGKVDAQ